jgi:hypothetical protein
MKRIGLIDVENSKRKLDKIFPNFAIMKISAYHKNIGDQVEWYDGYSHYDIVYVSKVFTFSTNNYSFINADVVLYGGTGYDIERKLPEQIEKSNLLDYSIYPECKYSIQFFSRGCIRNCPFCFVYKKEGKIFEYRVHSLNPKGKHIEILDNNFFANPNYKDAINWIIKNNQRVTLHGVDVRIMNEERSYELNKLKINGSIKIAWDNPKDDILPMIKEMIKIIKPSKLLCYIIIGYWSTLEEDYYRANELKKLGINVFCQPYRDFENKRVPTQRERDFAGWTNKKERFKSFDFKDFEPRIGFKCIKYFEL